MQTPKILFVVPKYSNTTAVDYTYMFPIGFAYVVSAVANINLPFDVINLNHMDGTSSSLVKSYLDSENYQILCTGGNSLYYRELKSIIKVAKEHYTKPLTVWGTSYY